MKITELHSGNAMHLTIEADDGALILHTVDAGLTPAASLRKHAAEQRARIERLERSARRLEAAAEQLEQAE